MEALYVPVANPAVLMDAVTGSVSVVIVPDAGLKVNHAALSATDQVKVLPPLLVTFTVIAVGFPAPCTALKDKLVGFSPMDGLGAVLTVNVTGTARGVFVAPPAETVIVPVWVPAVRPAVATLMLSVPAPVPDAGLRLSQLVFSVAVQLSVPLPELEIEIVLAAGLLPP